MESGLAGSVKRSSKQLAQLSLPSVGATRRKILSRHNQLDCAYEWDNSLRSRLVLSQSLLAYQRAGLGRDNNTEV
jgi:hypothetical protein